MFKSNDKEKIDNQRKELENLKKKNRYYQGVVLLGALQISSLLLCYYLGRSSKKQNKK